MDAFLFYIDDWFSSRKVEEMDQLEELAYFRLLLYAAKEPDCGLPKDPRRLAKWSRLGPQWGKPTKDPEFQFDAKTSGEKILECFPIEKDGRIYNDRALKVFNKYQHSLEQRRAAANKRWGNLSPSARSSEQLPDIRDSCDADTDAYASACADAYAGASAYADISHAFRNPRPVGNGNRNELLSTDNQEVLTESTRVTRQASVVRFPTNGSSALSPSAQLNPFEAFEQIWEAYPDAGRSRKEVSRAVFVGITAQFKGKEPELLAKILDGIATWQKSDLWNRGAVHGIRNWLSERLWVETPPPPQAIDSNSQRRRNERTATTFRRNDVREPEAACEHCADTGTVIKPEIMADLLNPKWCEMTEAEQRMPCPHCRGAK